jgi:uncharacterized membrane protein
MRERLAAVDLLRGLVMVLMVVDHAREYSAGPGLVSDPMDLAVTSPLLFVLRWASHFCAPVFAFLMGVSAHWSASRKPASEAARHFALRGLLLIVLEFTVIDWSWNFYPPWPRKFSQVIAALGVAQIAIAMAVRFPRRAALLTGVAIMGLHNLVSPVHFAAGTVEHYIWSFLLQKNVLPLGAGFEVRTTYPVLPVAGIALCGFGLASWLFGGEPGRRLRWLGGGLTALFVMLRASNLYGDPSLFQTQDTFIRSAMSFLNATKYPISLQFALMTLGPALMALGFLVHRTPRWEALLVLGRVPLFFYAAHLYALHAAAITAAWLLGFPASSFDFAHRFGGIPAGFGYPLWLTPWLAISITALLHPLCRWYAGVRGTGRYRLLAYL